MRIAILTSGRFHVCDLARELDTRGHEVAFYSVVPPGRTRRFGLPGRCNRWLGPFLAPLVALGRVGVGTRWEARFHGLLNATIDKTVARLIQRCDVLISMSGMSTATAEAVRRKYRAKVLVERGSRHILSQKEILDALPRRPGMPSSVPKEAVQRELADYGLADRIVVPAKHVVESFVERGVQESRLFCNPYGVSLEMFQPTPAPPADPPTVIMAGTWSLQKGCDVLVEAWRKLPDVHLLHVGPIGDAPVPHGRRFEHIDKVSQSKLSRIYARAHVFALASRQDGLALVQAQALASGLELVCTTRTGGADLAEMVGYPEIIAVVPPDRPGELAEALRVSLAKATCRKGVRDLLGPTRERLSWRAYGERYDRFLRECV